MITALKNNLSLLKIAFKGWWAKDPFREIAVIAYCSIFSLPGVLVVVVTFAGYFFGRDVVNKHITDQITAILSAFGIWISHHFSDSFLVVLQVVNFVFSFFIISVLFALMFKIFPDAKIKWKDVWIGSFLTAFLFEIGKVGLGLYLSKADPGIGYGAAGSVILILLWVSYSSMLVL